MFYICVQILDNNTKAIYHKRIHGSASTQDYVVESGEAF